MRGSAGAGPLSFVLCLESVGVGQIACRPRGKTQCRIAIAGKAGLSETRGFARRVGVSDIEFCPTPRAILR